MSRIIILGVDGASWALLSKWSEHLPGFARLRQEGTSGALTSILPPTTCPAWWAFATGKLPSTLGVFDFTNKTYGSDQLEFVNASYFNDIPIWEILASQKRESIVFNVPVTYPAAPFTGTMVTGMMTPSSDSSFTYPTELQTELLKKFPDYEFDIDRTRLTLDEAYAAQEKITEQHIQAIEWLTTLEQPNFIIAVLMAVDRIQHLFWTAPDLEHNDPNTQRILKTYESMDQWLTTWLDRLADDDYLFVLSDHGGQHCEGRFLINEWLRQNGYLYLYQERNADKNTIESWLQSVRRKVAHSKLAPMIRRNLSAVIKHLPASYLNPSQSGNVGDILDLHNTRAYALSANRIYLRVRGRDPGGIVEPGTQYEELRDEIISRLSHLDHPVAGRSLHIIVHRREEIYSGRHFESAPDLVLTIENGAWGTDTRIGFEAGKLFTLYGQEYKDIAGTHSMDGIFLAKGPSIRAGAAIEGRLIDVVPTILHLVGVEIPNDMDGNVLMDLFKPNNGPAARQVQYGPPALRAAAAQAGIGDQVAQRLKSLGYLS